MQAMLDHPGAQRRLCDEPSIIGTAVRPADLTGIRIAPGDKVVVSSRPPTATLRSSTARRLRHRRRGRGHLAFGSGPHFCLEAHLARVQMRAPFTELLMRTTWIEPRATPRGCGRPSSEA
jgi:cytochrome P450